MIRKLVKRWNRALTGFSSCSLFPLPLLVPYRFPKVTSTSISPGHVAYHLGGTQIWLRKCISDLFKCSLLTSLGSWTTFSLELRQLEQRCHWQDHTSWRSFTARGVWGWLGWLSSGAQTRVPEPCPPLLPDCPSCYSLTTLQPASYPPFTSWCLKTQHPSQQLEENFQWGFWWPVRVAHHSLDTARLPRNGQHSPPDAVSRQPWLLPEIHSLAWDRKLS